MVSLPTEPRSSAEFQMPEVEGLRDDSLKPLVLHLADLRTSLVRALIGLATCSIGCYAAFPRILRFLIRPPLDHLVFTSPTEPFFAQCRVAFIGGILLSFPWILYQIWVFVSPGLKPRERAPLLRLLPASYLLFLGGAGLGLFLGAPVGLKFLMSYSSSLLHPYITLDSYLTYLGYMTLGMALMFQIPLILLALGALGILEPASLARYRRHILLGILLLAAAITPSPDIYGQLIIAIPTYLLFELTLLTMRFMARSAGVPNREAWRQQGRGAAIRQPAK